MPTLSVCLIVKNEEPHLARCLQSVRDLATEIVVVDTGSTDRTVEIAREFGARVSSITWPDDFSAARNASLDLATGDWVFCIDADETISERDHAVIRATIARSDLDAEVVPQRHYLTADAVPIGWRAGSGGYAEGEPYPGFLDVDCRRLFRRTSWLRFRNAVHEELVSIDPAKPLRERRGAWVIHHFGKLGSVDLLRAKSESYLRIGRKKAEAQPDDPQAHYELGVQYAEMNDFENAVSWFEGVLRRWPAFRDIKLRLALCYSAVNRHDDALKLLRGYDRQLPDRTAEIALAEGNAHRAMRQYDGAIKAYRRALAANPEFFLPAINLAFVHSTKGEYQEALRLLDRVVAKAPGTTSLLARAVVRLDAGDDEGALADFAQLGSDPRAVRRRARILVRLRRFAEAADVLALMTNTDDAEWLGLRGAVDLGLGQAADAAKRLRRSLELTPNVDAAMNLATALQATGDTARAVDALAEASRLSPTDVAILGRVATAAADRLTMRDANRSALTVMFYQPRSIQYDGDTPRTRGLGGTESAAVYLAEALAARGHRSIILNSCEEARVVRGVEYAPWQELAKRCLADRPDVLVGVRFWEAIGGARLAPLQILWTGDAFDQPYVAALADRASRREIDFFMLQSDWHEETFHQTHQLPLSQILRTTLGTAASANAKTPIAGGSRPRRLAYASTPFRGLDVLLKVFPRIRAAVPDAELEIFSSMKVYGVSAEDDRKQYEAIYRKAKQPGVTLVGTVPQLELAERLQQARVLAYPNHYAETFCIAAAEAQAAGCAVVTSALGALPETVGDAGIWVQGDPHSRAYQDAFVEACVALLSDDAKWEGASARAVERAVEKYSWPAIAEHWERLCQSALMSEPAELARIAVHLENGRGPLAQRMFAKMTRPEALPGEVWSALGALIAGEPIAPSSVRELALCFPTLRRSGVLDAAVHASAAA